MTDVPMFLQNAMRLFRLFTTWNLLLVLFHKWTFKYIDLLFTTVVTMLIGFCITHFSPGYSSEFVVDFDKHGDPIRIHGWHAVAIDVVFHVLPFVFVYTVYGAHYKRMANYAPTMVAVLVLGAYLLLFDIERVYGANVYAIQWAFVLALLVYVALLRL